MCVWIQQIYLLRIRIPCLFVCVCVCRLFWFLFECFFFLILSITRISMIYNCEFHSLIASSSSSISVFSKNILLYYMYERKYLFFVFFWRIFSTLSLSLFSSFTLHSRDFFLKWNQFFFLFEWQAQVNDCRCHSRLLVVILFALLDLFISGEKMNSHTKIGWKHQTDW